MALRKYRYRPEIEAGNSPVSPASARLADDHDRFVASPVHDLQAQLWTLTDPSDEVAITPYPAWARVSITLGVTLALWAPIIWVIRLIVSR